MALVRGYGRRQSTFIGRSCAIRQKDNRRCRPAPWTRRCRRGPGWSSTPPGAFSFLRPFSARQQGAPWIARHRCTAACGTRDL